VIPDRGRELGQICNDLIDRGMARRPIDPDQFENLAAEADDRDGDRVDRDLDGHDHGSRRIEADHRRGPPGRSARFGSFLGGESGDDEFADEATDRAAGEAGRCD